MMKLNNIIIDNHANITNNYPCQRINYQIIMTFNPLPRLNIQVSHSQNNM